MSVLQEIQAWGATLPTWQQDAILRLYSNANLSAADEEELYALLKAAHGVADAKGLVAKALGKNAFVAPQQSGTKIQVLAIRDMRFVNALAENQSLPIAPDGLTVIYGDNGVGKSGYSRALKKACRARDKSESIHPDAKLPPGKAGKAQATFDISVNGATPIQVTWTDGSVAPTELSAIAIFDAHCARAYLDAEGDYSYAPYGMDILRDLAKLCNKLKARIEQEQAQNQPNTTPFAHLAGTATAVGTLIKNLGPRTKPADVAQMATLSPAEREQHIQLDKSLKDNNPKEKASQLRLRAARLSGLAQRCDEKGGIVSDAAVTKLQGLVQASNVAKAAAQLAAQAFKEMPGQLLGTGGEAWQRLYEAARAFAVESHPHRHFPDLGEDAQCPLCQQPLQEGAARLVAFDAFINNETEKAARTARNEAVAAYEVIAKADMSIGLEQPLQDELSQLDSELASACIEFSESLGPRVASIKKACAPDGDWSAVKALAVSPVAGLQVLAASLNEEAKTLDQAADEKARAELEANFKELDARVKLEPLKEAVLEAISKYVMQIGLGKCLLAVRTTAISNKASDLSEKVISKDLETALNNEFTALNAGGLNVYLKSQATKGKTYFKLALQLPGQQRPVSILSEGEQRAIAIGSFLAEVVVSGMRGGIVFDDPVSSLDHRRRWTVARRLVQEGAKRQVIVFTHDIYFLCALQQEAAAQSVPLKALALHRTSKGYGVASDRLPFDGTTSSKRVGVLRALHAECQKLQKAGDEQAASDLIRHTYMQLRSTWERAVEEVLFSGVVTRFIEGVSTQKLSEVEVLDSDYAAVSAGMTKASKFAHDGALAAHVATPVADELAADITAFDTWRTEVEKRKNVTRARRK